MVAEPNLDVSRGLLDRFCRDNRRLACYWAGEILRDPEQVNEAVQEAFLKATNYLHTYDACRPIIPWIRKIVRQVAHGVRQSALRQERYQSLVDDPAGLTGGDFVPDLLERIEREHRLEQIAQAIRTLAPSHRWLLTMEYQEEASRTLIASVLGIDNNALNCRMYRARHACQEAIANLEEPDPC